MFPYVPLVPTDPPTVLSPQPTVYMAQGHTIQLNCSSGGGGVCVGDLIMT